MIFSNDTSVFIPESCVNLPQTPRNDHEYYHGTTKNDPDTATVELWFRPRPQSNTIRPHEFKQFKLVVALSWRFLNHKDSSWITMVLLGLVPNHADASWLDKSGWIVALPWPKLWMCNWGFKSGFFINLISLKTVGESFRNPLNVLEFYANLPVWTLFVHWLVCGQQKFRQAYGA